MLTGPRCASSEDAVVVGTGGSGGTGSAGRGSGAAGSTGAGGTGPTGAAGAPVAGTTGTAGSGATGGSAGANGPTGAAGRGGAGAAGSGRGGSTGASGAGGLAGSTGAAGTGGAGGTVGRGGTFGAAGAGGRGASTGTAGGGGTTGTSGTTGTGNASGADLCKWPTASGSQSVSATITVTGTYDGGMKRFVGSGALGSSGQDEDQGPLFNLKSGATLQNVILGNPAADGVHCDGTCTLKNVWWEDVGEDAATLKGSSSSQTMTIDTGGATKAADKVFQHNGPGTMIIRNFCAQDFGKLYRSCGNCDNQYARRVELQNIMVIPRGNTAAIAGVNSNYNDTATFKSIVVKGSTDSLVVCQRYNGNNSGDEPTKSGTGADGKACIYSASDITWQP